eukprot:GHUV01018132.1.p1 GENE.GHUV01018132.1~~GHUV01018132.1.p1  ORF type:complete len:227 (+),score=49.70 GHUV01018132.1:955-1635(+)
MAFWLATKFLATQGICASGASMLLQLPIYPPQDLMLCTAPALMHSCSTGLLDFVFISHTGSDSDAAIFAAMLHDKLGEKKIPAFFDADSLDLGDVWQPRIIKAASRCSVFVAVVSPKYPTRKWPLLEMHLALQSAERSRCVVMPVLFGVERKDMEESTPISSDWRSAWHRIAAEGEDLARKAAHAAHDNLRQLLKSQTTHLLSGKKAPDLAKQVVQACEEHIQQHW